MTKTYYAVHFKKIWKDESITEIGADKNQIFENFEEAAFAANEMNKHEWKFHQERIGSTFYFVVEIKIQEEILNNKEIK